MRMMKWLAGSMVAAALMASPTLAQQYKMKIAAPHPTIMPSTFAVIARDMGFFKKENLEVELLWTAGGADAQQARGKGGVAVGVGGAVDVGEEEGEGAFQEMRHRGDDGGRAHRVGGLGFDLGDQRLGLGAAGAERVGFHGGLLAALGNSVTQGWVTDGAGWSTGTSSAHLAVPYAIRRSGSAKHTSPQTRRRLQSTRRLAPSSRETNPDRFH